MSIENKEATITTSQDNVIISSLQWRYVFLLIQVGLLLFFWKKLPPQVPLFYSLPWGERQLVGPIGFWLLPAICIVISLANFAFISLFFKEEKFLNKLLGIFTCLFNFLCLFTLLRIIILVI